MSGGAYGYLAAKLDAAASDIEQTIRENTRCQPSWRPETLERLREGVACLRRAAVYEYRIDRLLCHDDGEECFHKWLPRGLAQLEAEAPTRGVPVSITTAIIKAIEKGCKPRQAVLMQHHYNALLKAVGDILAYNEGLSDA